MNEHKPEIYKRVFIKLIEERGLDDVLNEISSQYCAWHEHTDRAREFLRRVEVTLDVQEQITSAECGK